MTPQAPAPPKPSKSRPAPEREAAPARAGQQTTRLTKADLLGLFRSMYVSRQVDDAEIALRKQNQVFFQISGAGHEAICAAAGFALRAGYDWFFPYYRDRALMLQLGMTPLEMLLCAVGAEGDPNSGSRQMPSHWGLKRANVPSQSSPTGTQYNQGVGCAEAGRIIVEQGLDKPAHDDEITLITSGEGATSEGEFSEALSTACIRKLPVIFMVEDNEYAISVPVEENTPGGDISRVTSGYPNLTQYKVDGNDLLESLRVFTEVVQGMRQREIGPVLLHALVTRPYSHSLSDDHTQYRMKAELEAEKTRDCLVIAERQLIASGHFTADELAKLKADWEQEVRDAVDAALKAPKPADETVMEHLYATDNSPLDTAVYGTTPARPGEAKDALPMGQAINRALHEELGRDKAVVVFGEDVADASRECALSECKGKGGVFKITHGLQIKYGKGRVFNSPLAEANIAGRAVGMAMRGVKPVVEIQFFDYIWPAYHQLRNEAATMRYRSFGATTSPLVVRTAIGGYLRGGAIYHSQSGEGIFLQCPGLRVVYPSNSADAAGLLRTAIRCDDPVLYLEHKHLYYQGYNRAPDTGPEYTIPFGVASVRREGADVTIVTWGALVQKSLEAAEKAQKELGVSAEVIDLRTLNPLDEEAIFRSVRKTSRLIVAAEEAIFAGFAGEICSLVTENCFEWLDAPPRRIGALDTWVAYSPKIEEIILPNTKTVFDAIKASTEY